MSMPRQHTPTPEDYYNLPEKLRLQCGPELPEIWYPQFSCPKVDSELWMSIVKFVSAEQLYGLKSKLARYFGVADQTIKRKLDTAAAHSYYVDQGAPTDHTPVPTVSHDNPGGAGAATQVRRFLDSPGNSPGDQISVSAVESWNPTIYDCSSKEEYRKFELEFKKNVRPENQCRDRPFSFMGPNGVSYPMANIEFMSAPCKDVEISAAPVPDSVFSEGVGYAIVELAIPVEFGSLKDVDTAEGDPLFLDLAHGSENEALLKKARKTHRHDLKRVQLKASGSQAVDELAEKVHEQLLQKMPQKFSTFDQGCRTYIKDHAAALATMEGALRQPVHVDNHAHPAGEGYSVLVAVESDVRLIVFENSHVLNRRISQLWELWNLHGMVPHDMSEGEWWDFTCWKTLCGEGWGHSRTLEAITVVIPKGHAMIFSSFLLHAGAEWTHGDLECFNRLHFYMTPFLLKSVPDVVNMHERRRIDNHTSFSPALRFLPQQSNLPNARDIPLWNPDYVRRNVRRNVRPRV